MKESGIQRAFPFPVRSCVAQALLQIVEMGGELAARVQLPRMARVVESFVVVFQQGEGHLSVGLHLDAVASFRVFHNEFAEVHVVATRLRMAVFFKHIRDRGGVTADIGTVVSVNISGPRTTAIVAHLGEVGRKFHGHAQAAQIARLRHVSGFKVYHASVVMV